MEPTRPTGSAGAGWWQAVAALILGVAIVVGTVITSDMVRYVKTFNSSVLRVTGAATQKVTSDQVLWTGNFSTNAGVNTLTSGYASMSKDKAAVLGYLTSHGVPRADITIGPVSKTRNFVNCKILPAGKACGPLGFSSYHLIQTVRVQSNQVKRITTLANDINGALIGQGVDFTTGGGGSGPGGGLQYYFTKLATLRTTLLGKATADAQKRAKRIVASTGGRLGPLVSVVAEPFQVTPVNSPEVSNAGAYDTTTIPKQVTAIVEATFLIPS